MFPTSIERSAMEELKFSTWGTRVFWTSFGLFLIYIVWGALSRSGVPGLLSGYLPPKWTIALLFFPALFLAYTVAALFDFTTKQGMSAAKPSESLQLREGT